MRNAYEGRAICVLKDTLKDVVLMRQSYQKLIFDKGEKYPESKKVLERYITSLNRDKDDILGALALLNFARRHRFLAFLFGIKG